MSPDEVSRDRPGDAHGRRSRGTGWALLAIVLVSFLGWSVAATLSRGPWIFADEVIYVDLARSLASGALPAVRGVANRSFGIVYPALIAPSWRAARAEDSYRLMHLINALALSLVAVPAFVLARRFVSDRGALTVAAFSVLVPSMAYAGTVLTEVAFYPLFVLALALLARALETAASRDQIVALLAIALAIATKVLAVALVGAALLAILLLAALARVHEGTPLHRSVRRFATTLIAVAGTTALLVGLSIVRGRSPYEWLGAYAGAVRDVRLGDVPREFLQHIAALSLYTAVVPVAAAGVLVLVGFGRRADQQVRLFSVLLLSTVVCTTAGVAVFAAYASTIDFAQTGTPAASPVYERNLFVVCPVLLLALALWIESRMPRPRPAAPLIAAGGALLMVVYPWSLIPNAANPQNLAPMLLTVLSLSRVATTAIALTLASLAAVVFLRVGRERSGFLWLIVGLWFAIVGIVAVTVFAGASRYVDRTSAGIPVDWVDRAAGRQARVTVLWSEPGTAAFARPTKRQRVVWVAEFFNRSVRSVAVLGPGLPYGLEQTAVRRGPDGQVVDGSGTPLVASLVLARCDLGLRAPLVAQDRKTGMALYRVNGRVRLGARRHRCSSSADS